MTNENEHPQSNVGFEYKNLERQVHLMDRNDWKINIENLSDLVANKYGSQAVNGTFARYDATSFEDLSPAFYWDVFGDLMQMDED